jgi:hypothetical protein
MPYVERDLAGRIKRLSREPTPRALEFLDTDHPEVRQFIADAARSSEILESLQASDIEFVRVLEDLIELLTQKGMIARDELPEAVRQKLLLRSRLRRQFRESPLIKLDDDAV